MAKLPDETKAAWQVDGLNKLLRVARNNLTHIAEDGVLLTKREREFYAAELRDLAGSLTKLAETL